MRRIVLAVGLVILSVLTLVRGADPGPIRDFRETYFDYLQRFSPRAYQDLPVRIVDIDEASLAAVGQWPWPRDDLARLVDRLNDYGAAVIAFDMIFAEPDRMSPSAILARLEEQGMTPDQIDAGTSGIPDTDAIFAKSIAAGNVALGVAQTAGQDTTPTRAKAGFVEIGAKPGLGAPGLAAPSPVLDKLRDAASGIGAISVSPDGAGTYVRQVPLIWQSKAGWYPALSLEALRLAIGASTIVMQGASQIDGYMETISVGDFVVLTQQDGQLRVHYREENPRIYIPAVNVLKPGYDHAVANKLNGTIVLIGTSAAGLNDIRTTALGQQVPGVSIHAQIIEQILLSDYLVRSEVTSRLEIIAFVLLGLVVLSVMTWFGPVASVSVGTVAGGVVILSSWIAFSRFGILFDATFPVVGGFLAFSGLAAYQFIVADRDKRLIRKSFSHYVAPGILDQIERAGHQIGLGGANRMLTVMFCDIRSFTPLSETMSATDLVALLNELFTDLGAQILDEGGTIDKFIGDAVMAFWNAPVETPDHRRQAALAALQMRIALRRFNTKIDHAPIAVAIGISSGIACVGNIGSQDRFNYSAIGDTVNVAARIEAACRHVEFDILLTESAAEGLEDMALLEAGLLDLKGKSAATHAYILVGGHNTAASKDFQRLRDLHRRLIDGLRASGQIDMGLLAKCRKLGRMIAPDLPAFYDRLPARCHDLMQPPDESSLGRMDKNGLEVVAGQ